MSGKHISSDDLYRLIIRQIADDGLYDIAQSLSRIKALAIEGTLPQSELYNRINSQQLQLSAGGTSSNVSNINATVQSSDYISNITYNENIEHQQKKSILSFPHYDTKFVTTHKSGVTCSTFSPDGIYSATGSSDCSIKLINCDKVQQYSLQRDDTIHNQQAYIDHNKPVIRSYTDHTAAITALEFHPVESLLFSGSVDCTINIFDISKQQYKRANMQLHETNAIQSLSIHPSGEFMLCSVINNSICKLYDLHTFQIYHSNEKHTQHHIGTITQCKWSSDGKFYVTCSSDGTIKIWDGHNNMLIRTIDNVHNGMTVYSVDISPTDRYILSSGSDNQCKLHDIATGNTVLIYTGCRMASYTMSTIFIDNGNFVLCGDDVDNTIHVWDSHTAVPIKKLTGHTKPVQSFSVSTIDDMFVSTSSDNRARFWVNNE